MKNTLMAAIAMVFVLIANNANSQANLYAPAATAPGSGGCYKGIGINMAKPDFPLDVVGAGVRINEYSFDRCIRVRGYQYSGGSPMSGSILWDGSNVTGCTTDFFIGGPGNGAGSNLGYYFFNIQKSASIDSVHKCGDTLQYGYASAAAIYGYDVAGSRPGSFQFYNNVLIDNTAHDGLVGIGTTSPSTQLHTTGGVRFAGLTTGGSPTSTVVADASGNLYLQTGLPVSSSCSTTNYVPVWTGTNQMGCSIIQQSTSLANCTTGTHSGVGIGGAPIATQTSGSTCENLALTVYGSAFASGGVWIASDSKFKTNVQAIPSALGTVMNLKGVSYDYKTDAYKNMNFPGGKSLGFIAQDLQKVVPEAVLNTDEGFMAVNYSALIPVLTEAIKELNGKIAQTQQDNASLQSQNAALQQQLNDICNGGCAGLKGSSNTDPGNLLMQNVPNPFNHQTSIGYVVNKGTAAAININSLDGKLVKTAMLTVGGAGNININANELVPGTYTYTLTVDGKVIDTKIMVITAQD